MPMLRRPFRRFTPRRPRFGFRTRVGRAVTARNFFAEGPVFSGTDVFENVMLAPEQWQVQGVDEYRSNCVVRSAAWEFILQPVINQTVVASTINDVHWIWQVYVIDQDQVAPASSAILTSAAWRNGEKILREGLGGISLGIQIVGTSFAGTVVQNAIKLKGRVAGPIKMNSNELLIFAISATGVDTVTPWNFQLTGMSRVRVSIP